MVPMGRDTATGFVNHWVTAAMVLFMLFTGWLMGEAPEAAEEYLLDMHVSIGVLLAMVFVWRVAYRFLIPADRKVDREAVARLVQTSMLVMILVQLISGLMYFFHEEQVLSVFSWFSLSWGGDISGVNYEWVEELHEVVGGVLFPLFLLVHFAGAVRLFAKHES